MSTKLFVGSLPWSVNDEKLKETFEKHGTVVFPAKRLLQTAIPIDPEVWIC